MKKAKTKNPWIKVVIIYVIFTALYIGIACYFGCQGDKPLFIAYVILAGIWGFLTGIWTHKAVTYKRMQFLEEERYRLIHENIGIRKELIDLRKKFIALLDEEEKTDER